MKIFGIKSIHNMTDFPKNSHLTQSTERAARLREVFEILFDINKNVPVIVEGKRDSAALRELGLTGEILTLHKGKSLYEFCQDISERFRKVVLLLDWDERGESLNKALCELLNGQWEEYSSFRELIKILCQKDIQDIEGIPKLLRRLETDEKNRH
ncbi:MAG: hypothetical protein LLF28_00035 [Nitrospiraceae bacterium]|nr:hypothetical protein [Nitrospiraceae bacterium]